MKVYLYSIWSYAFVSIDFPGIVANLKVANIDEFTYRGEGIYVETVLNYWQKLFHFLFLLKVNLTNT